MCVCARAGACACVRVCVYMCLCECVFVDVCARARFFFFVCVCVCVCVFACFPRVRQLVFSQCFIIHRKLNFLVKITRTRGKKKKILSFKRLTQHS